MSISVTQQVLMLTEHLFGTSYNNNEQTFQPIQVVYICYYEGDSNIKCLNKISLLKSKGINNKLGNNA